MLIAPRAVLHRYLARQRLAELAYLASDRQLRADLGSHLDDLSRRALRSGWSVRTTAGIAASVWVWRLSQRLEPERRHRIGRDILRQEESGIGAIEWLGHFESGRMNVVGEDVFLLRFNVASGMLASWIAEGRRIAPGVRTVFLAMAAWGLAGLAKEEAEERFEDMLRGIG